jgi:hypothetical protein
MLREILSRSFWKSGEGHDPHNARSSQTLPMQHEKVFAMYGAAAKAAQSARLGVNAGHDLNLHNLGKFCQIPGVLEVSNRSRACGRCTRNGIVKRRPRVFDSLAIQFLATSVITTIQQLSRSR